MEIKHREILLNYFADCEVRWAWEGRMCIDSFIGRSSAETFLLEGIKFLKELIRISRENDWLNDFVPSFEISLKNSEKIEKDPSKTLFKNIRCLAKNLSRCCPPDICMTKKILQTNSSRSEEHIHIYLPSGGLFQRIFGSFDDALEKNLYVKYVCMKNERDLENGVDVYTRYVEVLYNENNSKVIRDVKRLKLKDKASIELVKKLREEERQKTAEEE
ncbi:MAG: hypothetical protein LBI70_03400 [Rickettsiales bacterium]|jgi:hypothetical protein|nr:hypothetical protein [Rickettsiales bacterium]